MAKVKKYLIKSFIPTIFFFLGVIFPFFYGKVPWEEAPNAWDYGFAIVLPLIFIYILVTDIMAYRKANKELKEE